MYPECDFSLIKTQQFSDYCSEQLIDFIESYYYTSDKDSTFHKNDWGADYPPFIQLKERLENTINDKIEQIWFERYQWDRIFHPHHHMDYTKSSKHFTCGILCINSLGDTNFYNASNNKRRKVLSVENLLITFPSYIIHYVSPHLQKDAIRYTVAFNCMQHYDGASETK